MAYVTQPDEEDLEGGGPLVPGGAPTPTATPTATAAGAQAQKPKTSGRFADLGEYLRVNSGQNFGSQLAGKIGDDVTTASNRLGEANQEFKSRVDANTVRDTEGLSDKVGTDPGSVDVGAYSGLRDAQYKGPTSFSGAQDLYNQTVGTANAAAGKAQAAKSEGGRFALLDNYFGRPTYSQGQRTLDNLLVQNDPNSQGAFKQIQENAKELQSGVAQANQQLGDYAAQGKAQTEATRKKARESLGIDDAGNLTGSGAIGSTQSAVNDRLAQAQAEAERIANARNSNRYDQISPELAELMKQLTYGVNPGQYLNTVGKESITAAGVANPEEQARMRALAKLANLESPYEGEGAGKYYGDDFYDFNKSGFQNKVSEQKRSFEGAIAPIQSKIDNYSSVLTNLQQKLPGEEVRVQIEPDGPVQVMSAQQARDEIGRRIQQRQQELSGIYGAYGMSYSAPSVGGGIAGGGIR